ncbi:MAG: hypothetical protein E7214_05445 [Clostridium sp.]|nr:hypothetical protein [Clostridium sp.]
MILDSKKVQDGSNFSKKDKRIYYLIILVPLEYYIAEVAMKRINIGFFNYYINIYWGTGIMSYEHGWFLVSLFLYSIFYVIMKKIIGKAFIKKISGINFKKLVIIIIFMTICTI